MLPPRDWLLLLASPCGNSLPPSAQQLPVPHAVVVLCLRGPFLQHPASSPWQRQPDPGCVCVCARQCVFVCTCSCSYNTLDLNSSPHPRHSRQAHMTWAADLLLGQEASACQYDAVSHPHTRTHTHISQLTSDWACLMSRTLVFHCAPSRASAPRGKYCFNWVFE